MGQLNQFQILGIATCCLAGMSLLMPCVVPSKSATGMPKKLSGLDASIFFLIGSIACIAVALIFASGCASEGFGPSGYKYFMPLGPFAMPGSNNCAKCKGCRTGHSEAAAAP